jgi:hypothetical protein
VRPPRDGNSRPEQESGYPEIARRDGNPRVAPGADIAPYCPVNAGAARAGSGAMLAAARFHAHGQRRPAERWRHWIGCPCGCESRPPYVDDPDCVRRLPTPEPAEWGGYDVTTLGLAPHGRDRCAACMAVGV